MERRPSEIVSAETLTKCILFRLSGRDLHWDDCPRFGRLLCFGRCGKGFSPVLTVPIPTQTRDRRLNRRPRPQHDSSTRLEWDSVIVRYRNSGSGAVPLYNMYMYPIRRGSAHGSAAIALKRHGSRLPCMVMLMVVCDLRPPRRAASRPAWYLESVAWTERAAHPLWTLESALAPDPQRRRRSVGLRVTWKICLWATLCGNAMGGLGELERMAATACASTGTRRSNNVLGAIASNGPTKPCW